ncbi:MAG: ATP-grasp domain-containing protein [Deltaproteobacteria bacterium]|nr:ATP-grasp domain-containing protein [Deltaproteobacteria bacterium]
MDKIIILHTDVAPDASEDELDTLRQAQAVADAIISLGHEPVLLPFTMDLPATISQLRRFNPQVVFNLVETIGGKGSMSYFATALLDFLQLPYTGCRTEALFVTSNKPLTKKILHAEGIATPLWITSDGLSTGVSSGSTFLIKPSGEDASVGLDDDSVVTTTHLETMKTALRNRQEKIGCDCFAEAYIEGREFNVALLADDKGVRILPPAEMLFLNYPPEKLKILDYRAKWVEDSFEYDNTRRTLDIGPQDVNLVARLRDIALICWQLFGLHGYARVDFRVDQQGNPFVLEINANPCLSPDAGFTAALERTAITYPAAINLIIQDALRR